MTFYGLFVGVDRYAAPVSRLSCAVADATALAALFEDNFGGKVTRLLDADATREGILGALEKLATSEPDDVVVVSFSGHGTPGHALVPIDVDPARPAETSVHLDELAALIDAIPARRLLVALDCCFSGGFGGARVFAPTKARTITEDRRTLDRIGAGVGRVVVTACAAGEFAMETLETGHGLLTDAVLRGLQGHGPVDNEMLGLLATLEWVVGEVGVMADRIGEEQTPTIYGSFAGWSRWPVFEPGDVYAAAFPGRIRPPATEAWRSLEPHGLPVSVLDAWAERFPGLNDLQLEAVNNHGVLAGESVVVVAPTGSGKTLIGELAAIQSALGGGRSLFLLPQRALVTDKYEDFRRTYGDLLKVVRATGEYGDQVGEILSGHYDVALLTYEKFLSLAIANRHLTRAVSTVVVDELQMISDPNRGATVEFLLTMLRSGYGRGTAPQIVGLSAVIGETRDIARWMGGTLLRTETRPVPLSEGIVDSRGSLRVLRPDRAEERVEPFVQPAPVAGGEGSKQLMIPLVAKLVRDGKKVIVFRSTKGRTVGTAGYLAEGLRLPRAAAVLESLPVQDASDASARLRVALRGGVAFHNSDLDRDERAAIERAFRDPGSDLRVVVATTTLAMGINTPADAVIIGELTFSGSRPQPFSVAEYKNMAGRAGRPGFTEAGESYIIATTDVGPAAAWERYVLGKPEAVASRLRDQASDPQTLVVRTLAVLGDGVERDALLAFLNSSFAVWEAEQLGNRDGWSAAELGPAVEGLHAAGLIRISEDDTATLTELGRYAGESGVEVQSITRLAAVIDMIRPPLMPIDVLTLAQITVELDDMYIPWHRRSNKERARWANTLRQLGAQPTVINALAIAGDVTPRSKKAAAAHLFATAEPMAKIEATLMQHVRDRSASGPIRQVAGRTRDLLDAVLTVATLKGKVSPEELESLEQLAIRLELGLPEELVQIAEVYGAALNRGQYLALRNAALTTAEQVAEAPDDLLRTIVPESQIESVRQTAIEHMDA